MTQPDEIVREVLALLEPMVVSDGGSLRVGELDEGASRLVVDLARSTGDDACSTCVIDAESLKAFIDEGLQTRGVALADITVRESTPSAS